MNQYFVFPQEKFFAIPFSGNMTVNRSLLFELELNEYLDTVACQGLWGVCVWGGGEGEGEEGV